MAEKQYPPAQITEGVFFVDIPDLREKIIKAVQETLQSKYGFEVIAVTIKEQDLWDDTHLQVRVEIEW